MLKKELQKLLDQANADLAVVQSNNYKLMDAHKKQEAQITDLGRDVEEMRGQMKRISQSVYTMLRVKYKVDSGHENDSDNRTEDERFLMFIHELCSDNSQSITGSRAIFESYMAR